MIMKNHLRAMVGTTKAPKTLHIEMMINESKIMADKLWLETAKKAKLCGNFGVRLVLYVCGLGRDSADKKDWGSIQEIGEVSQHTLHFQSNNQ